MEDTYTELSKIFRNVTKLVREKTEDYFGTTTPLSRVLREVADEDNCSVPNSTLRGIAAASNSIENYHQIMQTVWSCMDGSPSQWRRIYKSLCLLEYLVLLGPPRVLDDCRNGSMRIRSLTNFRYHDGLREQGGGVRQKALQIVEYVDEPNSIEGARQKAIDDAAKYVGIENKPVFEFHTPATALPPGWGELGGAWRDQRTDTQPEALHPLPPNPYATMQRFQTAEDAARTWGIEVPSQAAPNLKMWATAGTGSAPSAATMESRGHYSSKAVPNRRANDLTAVELPPDDLVFGSAPDWWAGEEVRDDAPPGLSASTSLHNCPTEPSTAAPNRPRENVVTVNLLDDDNDNLIL